MRRYIPPRAHLIPAQAQKVFAGKIYDVYQWPQELYDGSVTTFEMLRRADTVKIMAIVTPEEQQELQKCCNFYNTYNEDTLIITKQKQPGKDWFYDYPGGRVDDEDDDELAGAKRELLEEAGLEFENWKLVEVHQPFNKIDWLVYSFVATGLKGHTAQKLDAGELIEIETASIPEILRLAKDDDSKYLRFKYFDKFQDVDELKNLPSLYNY